MQHPLHIRPAVMHMDGEDWVPASYAEMLAEALREKQRSKQAHAHQFAAIDDCFESLPAKYAGAPFAANADAFRKHGLIATGHCDVDTIDCGDNAIARRTAPLVARLARSAHGYAITIVRGPLVVCTTPHSQSYKAMGKDRFTKSKEDVLSWCHELLGVSQ